MDLLEFYIDLCEYILISMRQAGFRLRPRAGPGLWLIPLVPLAVLASAALKIFRDDGTISHIYFASAVVSVGLLFSTIIYLLKYLPRRKNQHYFLLPSVMTLLVLLVSLNAHSYDYDRANAWFRRPCGLSRSSHIFSAFVLSMSGGILSVYGVYCGLPLLFYKAPFCFTPGEAVLVIHAVVLFLFSALVNLVDTGLSQVNYLSEMAFSYDVATIILQVGGVAVLGMLLVLVFVPLTREPPQFFMVLSSAILFTVIALHSLLGGSPILWILYNIIRDELTFHIFLTWIGLSIAGCAYVYFAVGLKRKANTAQRKMFHVLAVIAFTSGILWAPDLLYLASGVCFASFLVLEAARCCQIPPLNEVLRYGFMTFSDEKDILIALTPIYLLGGMAAPLWLTPLDQIPIPPSKLLPYLAGVFTLGIGDTAASYYGSKFGVMPWPGTSRTMEGTVACFMSQVIFLGPLVYFGFISGDLLYLLRAMGTIGVVSLIEALTDQVDNLVLPLVFYTMTF